MQQQTSARNRKGRRMARSAAVALVAACAAGQTACASRQEATKATSKGVTIWIEGENATAKEVVPHPFWYDQVKKEQLSGGAWLSNWSDTNVGKAAYSFKVTAPGHYHFWLRANPVQTKLSYKLDEGANFTPIDLAHGAEDTVNVAGDGKPDLRFLAWKNVGDLDLAPGNHIIRFRMTSDNNHHGAIDCFTLTTLNFAPNGTDKPGAATAVNALGATWAFNPATDTFSPDAVFDLRSLNEKTAGESGFVKTTPDGSDFALGSGKPARFWAVTEYIQRQPGDAGAKALAHKARWLAKRGVNMVRFHGQISPKDGDPITKPNRDEIDGCWRLVAAMKKEGIYTTISPYWAFGFGGKLPASWRVPGDADQSPAALLFWDKTLQSGYKTWARVLFGEKNPYTGIRLADDPAVALIQIQNEDSMLFWTMQSIKGQQLKTLTGLFGTWLTRKYGSLDKANSSWGGENPGAGDFQGNFGDDFQNGQAGIYILWNLTQPQAGYKSKRLADQLAFYADTMRTFNRDMADFYHKELGCKQLVNAGNWKTADPLRLEDAERYSYAVNDVIGVNRYYGGIHNGPRSGWAFDPGDTFTNATVLRDPRALPINLKQVIGHPFIVSESQWVPPTLYQSEGPFLTAAYQSLTGVDAFYWFCDGDVPEWQEPMGKWNIATPMQLGQFPAAALMYRRGYIQKGKPVVVEERSLADLWQRKTPVATEDQGFDPNRDAGQTSRKAGASGASDPLAFLVGPVEVRYGAAGGAGNGVGAGSLVSDLAPYIDHDKKTIRSVTGELAWNYGAGLCTLNAPKAQGATGFLKGAGPIQLGDVAIQSGSDYATITVVALDNQPLATTKKALVQIGTVARPTGWQDREATITSDDGKTTTMGLKIVKVGGSPWQIAQANGTLTIKNAGLTKATLLDANGQRVRPLTVTNANGALTLSLPPDALYLVLE